jgi:hypothetical protein
MPNTSYEFSARNTTNVTVEIDWPWVPNPVQPPRPWWGALMSWLDVHLNHPLVLHAEWPWGWLPERLANAINWPCYQFCCWTSQWDRPVYMKLEPPDNRA